MKLTDSYLAYHDGEKWIHLSNKVTAAAPKLGSPPAKVVNVSGKTTVTFKLNPGTTE